MVGRNVLFVQKCIHDVSFITNKSMPEVFVKFELCKRLQFNVNKIQTKTRQNIKYWLKVLLQQLSNTNHEQLDNSILFKFIRNEQL